jgi:hypothetical protein
MMSWLTLEDLAMAGEKAGWREILSAFAESEPKTVHVAVKRNMECVEANPEGGWIRLDERLLPRVFRLAGADSAYAGRLQANHYDGNWKFDADSAYAGRLRPRFIDTQADFTPPPANIVAAFLQDLLMADELGEAIGKARLADLVGNWEILASGIPPSAIRFTEEDVEATLAKLAGTAEHINDDMATGKDAYVFKKSALIAHLEHAMKEPDKLAGLLSNASRKEGLQECKADDGWNLGKVARWLFLNGYLKADVSKDSIESIVSKALTNS